MEKGMFCPEGNNSKWPIWAGIFKGPFLGCLQPACPFHKQLTQKLFKIWMGNNLQTEKWNLPLSESLTSWLLGGNTNWLSSWVLSPGWLEWEPSAPSLVGASCSELVLITYYFCVCVFLGTTWKIYPSSFLSLVSWKCCGCFCFFFFWLLLFNWVTYEIP